MKVSSIGPNELFYWQTRQLEDFIQFGWQIFIQFYVLNGYTLNDKWRTCFRYANFTAFHGHMT